MSNGNPIDPQVLILIQQAVDDAASAAQADSDDAAAVQAVQTAQQVEDGTKAASIIAHRTALDSAGVAIKALADELGIVLPAPTP